MCAVCVAAGADEWADAGSIRPPWAHEIVERCQRSALFRVGELGTREMVERFCELARSLPSPQGQADRVFLRDRLAAFAEAGGTYFHSAFHRKYPGSKCQGGALIGLREVWNRECAEDPREVLRQWAVAYEAAFNADHSWPPAVRAAELLRARPDQCLDLTGLAAAVSCSRSVLIRSFRREFGRSVGEFLRELRLSLALDAMEQTNWSVDAIARLVGYCSEASLYRALRRQKGTPINLRKRG